MQPGTARQAGAAVGIREKLSEEVCAALPSVFLRVFAHGKLTVGGSRRILFGMPSIRAGRLTRLSGGLCAVLPFVLLRMGG